MSTFDMSTLRDHLMRMDPSKCREAVDSLIMRATGTGGREILRFLLLPENRSLLNQSSKSGEEILVTILPSSSSKLLEKTVKQFIKQGTFFGGAADDVNSELNRLILDYYFEIQADKISRRTDKKDLFAFRPPPTAMAGVKDNLKVFKLVMDNYRDSSKQDQDVSHMAKMMNLFMQKFPVVNKESNQFFDDFVDIIEDDFLKNQGKLFKACFSSDYDHIDKQGPFKFAVLHCMVTDEYILAGTPKQIKARDCLLQVSREIMVDSAEDPFMLKPYKDFVRDIISFISRDAIKDSSSQWVSPGERMARWARDTDWFVSSLRKSIVSAPSHVVITRDGFNGFDELPQKEEHRTKLYHQLQIRGLLTKDGGITDRMVALHKDKKAFYTQFMFGSVGADEKLFHHYANILFDLLKDFADNKYGEVKSPDTSKPLDTKSLDTFKQQGLVDAKGWANVSKEHYDDLVSCYSGGRFKDVDEIKKFLNNQLAPLSSDLLNLDENILTILRNKGVVDNQGYVTLQFQKLYFESKTQGTFIEDYLREIDSGFDISSVKENIKNQLETILVPLNLQQFRQSIEKLENFENKKTNSGDFKRYVQTGTDDSMAAVDEHPLDDAYKKEKGIFQDLFCKEFLPSETFDGKSQKVALSDTDKKAIESLNDYAARLLAALKQEGAIVGGEIHCLDPQRLLENYGLPSEDFSIDSSGKTSVNLKKWLEAHSKHKDAIDRFTEDIIKTEGFVLTDQSYQDPKKASGPMYNQLEDGVSIRPGKGLLNSFFVADELALPENYNVKVGVVNELGKYSFKDKDRYRYWVKTKMKVDDIAKMLADPNLTAQGRDFLLKNYLFDSLDHFQGSKENEIRKQELKDKLNTQLSNLSIVHQEDFKVAKEVSLERINILTTRDERKVFISSLSTDPVSDEAMSILNKKYKFRDPDNAKKAFEALIKESIEYDWKLADVVDMIDILIKKGVLYSDTMDNIVKGIQKERVQNLFQYLLGFYVKQLKSADLDQKKVKEKAGDINVVVEGMDLASSNLRDKQFFKRELVNLEKSEELKVIRAKSAEELKDFMERISEMHGSTPVDGDVAPAAPAGDGGHDTGGDGGHDTGGDGGHDTGGDGGHDTGGGDRDHAPDGDDDSGDDDSGDDDSGGDESGGDDD